MAEMDFSSGDEGGVQPRKSYKNLDFMGSREARTIRVICEFEEPLQRLRKENVKETILFFGSSQAMSRKRWEHAIKEAEARLAAAGSAQEKQEATDGLALLQKREWLCDVYANVRELSRRLTEWAMTYESNDVVGGGMLGKTETAQKKRKGQSLMVCTGGGDGLMRAANKGALDVPGAKSIGMGISLPSKKAVNPYVTENLAFEFHYFFSRKYWMLYPCRALIVPAGGFYTLDTLFELLTLKQTGKIKIDIPVVMFGTKYWKDVIKFDALVKFGTISQKDYDDLFFTDSVEEAFAYVTKRIVELRDRDAELFYSRSKSTKK